MKLKTGEAAVEDFICELELRIYELCTELSVLSLKQQMHSVENAANASTAYATRIHQLHQRKQVMNNMLNVAKSTKSTFEHGWRHPQKHSYDALLSARKSHTSPH